MIMKDCWSLPGNTRVPARRPVAALASVLLAASTMWATAPAQAGTGQPTDYQFGLQGAVTDVMRDMIWFHDSLLMPIITVISLFVLLLLIYVMVKFNRKANPTPSRTSHNSTLEFAWTVIPIIILLMIAFPSFKLLYKQYDYPQPDLTIKAIGNQWYWDYEYPGTEIAFSSYMVTDTDILKRELGGDEFDKRYAGLEGTERSAKLHLDARPLWTKFGMVRTLSTDNDVVVPVNAVVHVLITANDVIHNWTIPSFGSKMDAVPGRVTATWFKAEKPGTYYGQCSELCGVNHAFMPITVRVVSEDVYRQWLAIRSGGASDADEQARELIRTAMAELERNTQTAALGGSAAGTAE